MNWLAFSEDVQDLMKHVTEQCRQMSPKVRAVFTQCEVDGKSVVSAEIPSQDVADRPCFYEGRGRYRGSYVRVGDADEPMTEYGIYSYEAFRKRYEDEARVVARAKLGDLDRNALLRYELALAEERPHVAHMEERRVLDLMSVTRDDAPTLAGVMVFSPYPQAFFPQLGVIATRVPGTAIGDVGRGGERFIDNARIEGPLEEQLRSAVAFARKNMRVKTVVSPVDGVRDDEPQYPVEAVRELVLNALIHRDYSIHTQGMPIQLHMFDDRLVVTNPGGLYGRMTVDQLGKAQPDTRNPVIANILEVMGVTENRYSGIPTVRRLCAQAGLPEPVFENVRGEFRVTLWARSESSESDGGASESGRGLGGAEERRRAILEFCRTPRTRTQIVDFLGLSSSAYAMRTYVYPLVADGKLALGMPGQPKSRSQTFRTV